ncbi:hypothetical protein U1Q18_018301 [Sarracenia purpurea var. burkii]
MVSKKMKGIALGSSPYSAREAEEEEDAKARFKHQTLIRDYKQLRKEAKTMRNKLVMMKHKKLTLLAEVRYLKQRYKYLLKMKTINPPWGRDPIRSQNFETRSKNTAQEKIYKRKKTNLQNLPTLSDVNQKDRNMIHSGKEATFRNTTSFDLNHKERPYGGKELAFQNPIPIFDLKQKGRLYNEKDTSPQNPSPAFDLNQIERTYIG